MEPSCKSFWDTTLRLFRSTGPTAPRRQKLSKASNPSCFSKSTASVRNWPVEKRFRTPACRFFFSSSHSLPPLPAAFSSWEVARDGNKAIPRELETIVLKAIEKTPAERYARVLEDRGIRAKRPRPPQRAAAGRGVISKRKNAGS